MWTDLERHLCGLGPCHFRARQDGELWLRMVNCGQRNPWILGSSARSSMLPAGPPGTHNPSVVGSSPTRPTTCSCSSEAHRNRFVVGTSNVPPGRTGRFVRTCQSQRTGVVVGRDIISDTRAAFVREGSRSNLGRCWTSSSKATVASRRARCAPMQKWIPRPKARCDEAAGVSSGLGAAPEAAVRSAEAHIRRTVALSGSGCPPRVAPESAVR